VEFPTELIVIPAIFLGMPWIILHYITKWKTAATLTNDDEALLEELYQLARRLDDRMETVERLVSAEHPEFVPDQLGRERDADSRRLRQLEQLRSLDEQPISKGRIAR
jgi:phage shock protein B